MPFYDAKFRENKTLTKISEFTVTVLLGCKIKAAFFGQPMVQLFISVHQQTIPLPLIDKQCRKIYYQLNMIVVISANTHFNKPFSVISD